MAKALYDLCRKDGTVMVYSITGPEVAAAIGCKLQDVYNSACYGQLIQHTYYAEVIDRPLSRRKGYYPLNRVRPCPQGGFYESIEAYRRKET